MSPDDFERLCARQPLRQVPPDWREEILHTARCRATAVADEPFARSESAPWWRVWLWPCPQAWAGLGVIWLLLLGVNMSSPRPPDEMARKAVNPENAMTLLQQRRELARLLENSPEAVADPQKPVPGPRSESTALRMIL